MKIDKEKELFFKKILIQVRKLSVQNFFGNFRSKFKGEGVEFHENREYQYGDSIKHINWSVSAKHQNDLYTKVYREERQQQNLLILDCSSSMFFKTTRYSKMDIAIAVTLILAFSSISVNDLVGLIIFTDKIESFFPFKSGQKYFFRIFSYLKNLEIKNSSKSALKESLEFSYGILNKRSNIFVISDFYSDNFLDQLKILGINNEIITIPIFDPQENENLVKSKSLKGIESNVGSYFEKHKSYVDIRNELKKITKNYIGISTIDNYLSVLENYFRNV